jgi:hypothetical protein
MKIRKRVKKYVEGSYLRRDDFTGFTEVRSDMMRDHRGYVGKPSTFIKENPLDRAFKMSPKQPFRKD